MTLSVPKILSFFSIKQFFVTCFAFLLSLFAFMFFIVFFVKLSSYSDEQFFSIGFLFNLTLSECFLFLNVLIVFSVFFAGIIIFYRLNRSSELIIFKVSGISIWKIIAPIIVSILLLGILYILALNPLVSLAKKNRDYLSEKYDINRIFDDSGVPVFTKEKGLWLREELKDKISFVHAKNIQQKNYSIFLDNIILLQFDLRNRFLRRIESKRGKIEKDRLQVFNPLVIEPGKANREEELHEQKTYLTIDKIQESFESPSNFSFWELPKLIEQFEDMGFSARNHRLHFYKIISFPLYLISLFLLGSVFTINIGFRGGSSVFKIVLGIISVFGLFFLREFLNAMSLSENSPLILTVFGFPVSLILLSISILLHIEDG